MAKLLIKPLKNYEKQYYILSNGKIWSRKRKVHAPQLKYSDYRTYGGKYLKQTIGSDGYCKIILSKNNKRKYVRVNRIIAETFIPNPYNKPYTNHINFDVTDNRVENLEWCTQKENYHHSKINGRNTRGSKISTSKLTENQVKEIRRNHRNGVKIKKDWNNYNITKKHYDRIINRTCWTWLEDE